MIVQCLSRCLPRSPLQVSAAPAVKCCPTCAAVLSEPKSYCSECGQCFDQDTDAQWVEQLSETGS